MGTEWSCKMGTETRSKRDGKDRLAFTKRLKQRTQIVKCRRNVLVLLQTLTW